MDYFTKEKEFFIGIDSDGCTFDTMEPKHKKCFCPCLIDVYELEPIAEYVTEVWNFVNLYSSLRGTNRFLGVVKTFELLEKHKAALATGFTLPDITAFRDWATTETKLGMPELEKAYKKTGDAALGTALKWSSAVNESISKEVSHVPPYDNMVETTATISDVADTIVVSSADSGALKREWNETILPDYVRFIGGQEVGNKTLQIAEAMKLGYESDKALMIGDAPGDLQSAKDNNILFYPIITGDEAACWSRFQEEGLKRFLDGTFAGDYQTSLINKFNDSLPDLPPWETVD